MGPLLATGSVTFLCQPNRSRDDRDADAANHDPGPQWRTFVRLRESRGARTGSHMGVSNNFLDKGFSANLVSFGVRVFSRVSLALPQPLSPPFSTKNPPIFMGGGGVFIKTQK